MPAVNTALVARDVLSPIVKRENWAQQEPGVILVFCIVFVVAVGVISVWIYRKVAARKASTA